MNLQDKKACPKEYTSPKLLIYGNISEMTQNITNKGTVSDNPSRKT
jgi:hypothetical protein